MTSRPTDHPTIRLLLLLAIVGCGTSDPSENETRLEIVGGDDQRALEGDTLAAPLVVRVSRGGRPISNAGVEFEALGGGETFLVNGRSDRVGHRGRGGGWVRIRRDLNVSTRRCATPGPPIRKPPSPSARPHSIRPRLRSSSWEPRRMLPPGSSSTTTRVSKSRPWSPSHPASGANPWSRSPCRWPATSWSPSPAATPRGSRRELPGGMVPTTVNAPIGAPIRIPVAVVILTPPFGTHALNAKRHLAEAAALWRRAGIELDWSDTDPIDATGHPGAAAFQAPVTPCAGVRSAAGGPAGRLNIYYAGGLVGYNGFACGGFIMLSVTGARGALLAHEMGHEFGLPHEAGESGNLMAPRAGSIITEGQAFRAHFHSGSVVNAMFGIHRKEVVRNCDEPGPKSRGLQVVTRCPPTTFGIELR